MDPNNRYRYDLVPMFRNETIDGRPYVVLTAYFVRPGKKAKVNVPINLLQATAPTDLICTTGRTAQEFISQGTGTGLWFQNGPSPNVLISVPRTRAAASQLGWTDCECFPGMGLHNFYEVR